MPGRKFNSGNYRFGFNGKENDKSFGSQIIQDYGFRLYNPALGKFLSVDPLSPEYPWYTPYQFAGNKPINSTDLDGLEENVAIFMEKDKNEFSGHRAALKAAGYKIIEAKNGAEILEKLSLSQAKEGPTKNLVFLTHGFVGGLAAKELNSGFYSDDFIKINRESDHALDASMTIEGMGTEFINQGEQVGLGGTTLVNITNEKRNLYATIDDFKAYVD